MKSVATSTTPWTKICYGIDSGVNGINMVRAERSGRKISFQTISFDSKSVAKAVACGAAIASGMPVGKAIATKISAPFKSITKAQRVFPTLLDIQIPFPLEDCLYNFTETTREGKAEGEGVSPHIASSKGKQKPNVEQKPSITALAIAARKTDIERRLADLAAKDIDPHVLDYEGTALWTQLLHEFPNKELSPKDQSPLKIIVFMRGEEGVMVIGRGTEFLNAHKIRTSEPATLDRCLQVQLNKHNQLPDIKWFWAGQDTRNNKNSTTLKSHISKRWMGNSTTVDDPETFLARALATRALLPGPLRANLRSDTFAHSGAQTHLHTAKKRSTTTIFIAGILLCCASAAWEYSVATHHKSFSKKFKTRITNILGYTPTAKGPELLLTAERELETIAQQRKPLTATFKPSLLSELQQLVATANKHDINIEHFQLESGKLQIKGSATTKAKIQNVNKTLSDIGYKCELTINESKKQQNQIFILNATQGGEE